MANFIKPGTDNQRHGRYVEVGPRGGSITDPRIVHIDRGDRLPPTQKIRKLLEEILMGQLE